MINKIYPDADSALEGIADGVTIMFGGFASAGSPSNLILALKRRGTRELTGIANNIGLGDKLDELCEAHQLRKMIASFAIRATGTRHSLFEEQYKLGEVELELVPQGTLAERMRAAGAGIPGFYTATGVGTVIAEGKEIKSFEGRDYLLERALTADFALIKADTADSLGNLTYHGTGRNFNPVMATAAKTVIAEVRRLVGPGEIDPEHVVTPGLYVDRIVCCDPIAIRWHA